MKHIFGPVPSRRLGQSLGIDTIPLKTCNWNCVYCQLGRSKPLCNQRKDYIPISEILSQFHTALKQHTSDEINWITFVGSGEPTLHAGIGYLIKEVRSMTNIPVAVITNGSLLFLKSVRDALHQADAVLPGLDAGTPELYKKLNRPHPDVTFDRYIGGLVEFRQEYRGKMWVEVMLVKDLNDTPEALEGIARQIEKIRPEKIHIGMPTRPPVEKWVHPPTEEGVLRAIEILGKVAEVASPLEGKFDIGDGDKIVDAILAIITRHPMSEEQLLESLADFPEDRRAEILENLQASPQVQVIQRLGRRFWCGSPSVFPDSGNHNK